MRRIGVDQEVVFIRRRPGNWISQGFACKCGDWLRSGVQAHSARS
ncbi:hypothetical protein TI01_0186 [Lysobacter sp. A03]|nr:hypothetical protein TI01_0186 [Lysobacter sp. A03]